MCLSNEFGGFLGIIKWRGVIVHTTGGWRRLTTHCGGAITMDKIYQFPRCLKALVGKEDISSSTVIKLRNMSFSAQWRIVALSSAYIQISRNVWATNLKNWKLINRTLCSEWVSNKWISCKVCCGTISLVIMSPNNIEINSWDLQERYFFPFLES